MEVINLYFVPSLLSQITVVPLIHRYREINREINNDQDHVTLQEDLDNLNNWANKWQLNFNFN